MNFVQRHLLKNYFFLYQLKEEKINIIYFMNQTEKEAHADKYRRLKNSTRTEQVKQKFDLQFHSCKKEIQSKVQRLIVNLQQSIDGYQTDSINFIKTWLAYNSSLRTRKSRRDGRYYQYDNPKNFENLDDFFVKLSLFDEDNVWYWRITDQFRKKVSHQCIFDILAVMYLTLKGYFKEANIRSTKVIKNQTYHTYQSCYAQQFKQQFIILFEVVVETYPYFDNLYQFQGFQLVHTMVFYDYFNFNQYSDEMGAEVTKRYLAKQSQYHRCQNMYSYIKSNQQSQNHSKQLFISDKNKDTRFEMEDINLGNTLFHSQSFYPKEFQKQEVRNQYMYHEEIGAWVSIESVGLSEAQMKKIYWQQMTKDFCQKFDLSLKKGKLIKLLEIPSLKIQMTEQEKNVVGSQGNILVIGRSGTGKTTCAVLRLFALQLLFKLRINHYKKKNKEIFDSQGVSKKDIDSNLGLKCVFATASPVLANEVKQYYKALTDQINQEIAKNRQGEQEIIEETQVKKDHESDEDEEKFKAELNKFESFDQMGPNDFPVFFTIRKLIQMIDGSLYNPFFKKYSNTKAVGNTQLLSQWHNENHGVVRLNKDEKQFLDSDDEHEENSYDSDPNSKQDINFNRQPVISKEVTYEVFLAEFWPTLQNVNSTKILMKRLKGITPGLLWTHIYSYIKGSALCYARGVAHLDPGLYYGLQKKLMLKPGVMGQIYDLFLKYEQWKKQNKYYDLMDAVNYILNTIRQTNTKFKKIHYLMVDEVQDLPDNVLVLLSLVTEFSTVLSGDTAQNIAKGVGFRFQDLNSLFQQYNEKELKDLKENEFKRYHLTINFRSHNNILQLANSVVSLLELCFPLTIDTLEKEKSNLLGPKPAIIYSQETLFLLLNGSQQESQIKFGCNQVIIVKDQESKEKVPQMLKSSLILTIYEAKGLEFDDVILYNFFNDSSNQWNILQQLTSYDELVDIQQFNKTITLHNVDNNEENIFGYQQINDKYLVKKLKFKQKQLRFDLQQYSVLCNDLKQLYVAITRAKKRFLIYDQDSTNREGLQNLWSQLQLVDICYQNDIPIDLQNQLQQSDPLEWLSQGKILFKNKFYQQAMKCFTFSEDEYWYTKANAYYLAEEGTNLLAQLQITDKKFSKKKLYYDIENQKRKLFRDASKLFIEINQPKQAAQCLYSAEYYEEAFKIYEDQGWLKEAAEAAYQSKLYSKSGDLFYQINDFLRALDAYQNAEDWDGLFKTLLELKNQSKINIQTYVNKYLPIVLNRIQDKLGEDDKQDQQNNQLKEQLLEINEIDEHLENINKSDQEDDEVDILDLQPDQVDNKVDQNDVIVEQGDQLNQVDEKQQDQQDEVEIIIEDENDQDNNKQDSDSDQNSLNEDDFSIISQKKNKQNKQLNKQNQSESFIVDISQHQSQNDFEHLSNYDLDDYWLKSDSKSIIDSIQSQKGINADFSALSFTQIFSDPSIQLVKTKCNIYIQDEVMQLIIKWISQFSEEFKQLLKQQRNRKTQNEDVENAFDVILDLDQVDIEFIDLVLDVLEQFQLFKLCIFVCNRYKLINKLNRYIVSIAAQYTPILIHPLQVLKSNTFNLNKYKQKGIVASFAIHSVFENINLQLLLSYNQDQLHQQLIMLGYWKKIAYQLKQEESLNIFQTFQDFRNWNNVYFKQIINRLQAALDNEQDQQKKNSIQGKLFVCQKKQQICFNSNPQDLFYFDYPIDEFELQFTINSLEHIYTELIKENRSLIKIKLPQFLIHTEQLWNSIVFDQPISEELIIQVCSQFNNFKQSYQLHESTLFLITFVKYINENQNSQLLLKYQREYSNKTIILIRDCLQLIINSFKSNNQSQKYEVFLRSILLLHQIRLPKGQLFGNYSQNVIIKRDSIILEKLIKKKGNSLEKNNYFIDIDFDFLIAPIDEVCQITENNFRIEVKNLFYLRLSHFRQYFEDKDNILESLGTIIANRYNVRQENYFICDEQQVEDKLAIKLLIDFEDQSFIDGFVNELISQLMMSNNQCSYEPTVKVKLLEIALSYINNSQKINDSHNYIIKGMLLMNFIQKNHYSYLFIDQISQNNHDLKYYHKYLEYLVCRKYNIISDASECYFEYYEILKHKLNVDEMLNDLTFIFVNQLISFKKRVLLPQILINYTDDTQFKKPLYPIDDNQLCMTIQYVIENFYQFILFSPEQVLLIILSYIINVEVIPTQILQSLRELKNQQIVHIIDNVTGDLNTRIQNICPELKASCLDNQELFEITVENTFNQQQLEQNYQDCINQWESIKTYNKNLITIAHKISHQWSQYKQKIQQIDQRWIKSQQMEGSRYVIPKQQTTLTIWGLVQNKLVQIRRNLIQTRYTLKSEIDFHFISQKLQELNHIEEQYKEILRKDSNRINCVVILSKLLTNKSIEELEQFDNQIRQYKFKQDNIDRRLQRLNKQDREQIRQKWIKQSAGIGNSAIEKKKASIIKEQIIQASISRK
ncbi:hypothetical protein pb186bvf_016131 [Paramecium bursaria]